MLNLVSRRMRQLSVAAGTDAVMAAVPIPQGGSINQIHLDMRMMTPAAGALSILKVVMYGIDIYVVPQPDPDTVLDYNSAWDRFVPKDSNIGGDLTLDTTATDGSPTHEPGQIAVEQLFDMIGLAPKRLFKRRRMISFADIGPVVGGGAILDTYNPAEAFQTVINQGARVNQPSYCMIGFSSPDLIETTTTIWTPPDGEHEWAILQYMEKFMEDAFIKALELIEAGAESPYEEVEIFIEELLEHPMIESVADSYHPTAWTVFCNATFNISVPGRLPTGRTLTSDGAP